MADQETLRELDLSNKEDRKFLKRLIAEKNKNRSYELRQESYRNIKKGSKRYNFTVMSDGTFRYNNETDRIKLDNANLRDAISNSNHPLFSYHVPGAKDIESDMRKYKVSVTYEEPKAKPKEKSTDKTSTNQGNKSSSKSEGNSSPKPATSAKTNVRDKSSTSTKSDTKSNTNTSSTLSKKPDVRREPAKIDSTTTENNDYTINLPEVTVDGVRGKKYARAYRSQHLGESKGNSYKQTPLLTRLRNWWNSGNSPQPLLENYISAEKSVRAVPGRRYTHEKTPDVHFIVKDSKDRRYAMYGFFDYRPMERNGGVIKAQQGTELRSQNTLTPTLDAIMNNPLLAESFLLMLSQQLGKEISMEDLVTASLNPELAPQLEAIAQQVMRQSAALGAKLQYISRLRGKCPEGQELVYFAKGGKVCSACMGKKLEDGGKPKYMKDFEEKQKAKKGCKLKK